MFPMISGLQELIDSRKIINEVMGELDQEGAAYDRNIKVGLMIEVPSAVTVADMLAKYADFFSIGTNDLIQYALAIDRVNEHVAFMYQPFHPAILRMILQVIKAGRQAGIKVALCGEMAGDPLCTSVLLAMGIDELSINAGGIPMIKKVIRSLSLEQAKTDLRKIMKLDTSSQVREFIVKKMKPLLDELDHKLFIAGGG
jgi:phosphotransferase system enzyme I (PtsI)